MKFKRLHGEAGKMINNGVNLYDCSFGAGKIRKGHVCSVCFSLLPEAKLMPEAKMMPEAKIT
jgi:hypothetical protein